MAITPSCPTNPHSAYHTTHASPGTVRSYATSVPCTSCAHTQRPALSSSSAAARTPSCVSYPFWALGGCGLNLALLTHNTPAAYQLHQQGTDCLQKADSQSMQIQLQIVCLFAGAPPSPLHGTTHNRIKNSTMQSQPQVAVNLPGMQRQMRLASQQHQQEPLTK